MATLRCGPRSRPRPGAPTVLLYAHYDVQPAPVEQGWHTDPFVATTAADGRIYGRGAADDKSGLVIHAGTLQLLGGDRPRSASRSSSRARRRPISHLEAFVEANPAMFDCDAFVIADMGNQAVGRPALTTALRGDVVCTVTVRTLDFPCHSGVFGGAAPDALIALIRILATLHDDAGDTVGAGRWPVATGRAPTWTSRCTGRAPGCAPGSGWSAPGRWRRGCGREPSVTVIGLDAPRVAEASNVLIPRGHREGVDAHRRRAPTPEHELDAADGITCGRRALGRRRGGHQGQDRAAVRRRHGRPGRARSAEQAHARRVRH